MACESCKVYVKTAIEKLHLHPVRVELGEVDVKEDLKEEQKKQLNSEIRKVGLEIVENKGGILIEQIKKCIFDYVNEAKQPSVNFSDYLSKTLGYDYNYLSNIFSEIQASTITSYMNSLKMERAKELILFEELSLSEIADKLHYGNLSHFSAQFKKVTGFAPSHFKKLKNKRRKTIQELMPIK
jgi:YesN/AraC family two-component response regulator